MHHLQLGLASWLAVAWRGGSPFTVPDELCGREPSFRTVLQLPLLLFSARNRGGANLHVDTACLAAGSLLLARPCAGL